MLPSAVTEQQAKLGVSAEESKAQRIKRLQSRFRDRGGAFVPSNSNPLLDVLLARTVSGESPSKPRAKNVAAKRPAPRKSRQTSPTRKAAAITVAEKCQVAPGGSKPKVQASRKRKATISELEDSATKSAPKRRGRPPKVQKNPAAERDDAQPPVPKPKKRKKEEDNYDDRPRKAVKPSDTGPPHSSSQKLKENQSDTNKRAVKASIQDELDATRPKLSTKPPSRSLASKGPPLDVLKRIKASAAQHLNRADSEPDELDCLS